LGSLVERLAKQIAGRTQQPIAEAKRANVTQRFKNRSPDERQIAIRNKIIDT
jgi:hypothetical protein